MKSWSPAPFTASRSPSPTTTTSSHASSSSAMKPILCPIGKKPVDPASENVPFCSDRCRLIDLGKWASGDYKVSSPIQDPELLEELARCNKHNRTDDDDEN